MTFNNTARTHQTGRGVIAVLGPTNTGKTHLAIERMTAHESGLIGLPLRLLAREVYGRIAERVGVANVALITGEEKINAGGNARYQVCTVEAMPDQTNAAFVAIDEVQLAADLERGHIFTDRLMHLRGRDETMLLGAETVRRNLQELLPGINVITRPRMSMLTWAGQKKITRLPRRSAIVAFSADEVYAIAELIRRQRGGAAVVLGSLSPRARNAQVALYQSGDIDFLVATDAIGMGLNLDVDHVAFAQDRKFDGLSHRRLTPAEMGQVAGRAGRHVRDGTFGVTGQVDPFDDELVQRLETHEFEPVKVLIWRNRDLDFASIASLRASLERASNRPMLMKSFPAADVVALDNLSKVHSVASVCTSHSNVGTLWDVCQIPDYRRISPGEHAELLRNIFLDLISTGTISEDWFADQVGRTDRTEGDIDVLSARIAQIRTWTYLSNRAEWLHDPVHWQEKTREIEDRLSDALHQSLTKRFIDRRTSVLMKRLRENAMLEAEISPLGSVMVEGHPVGQLNGFRFTPDASATGPDAKAATSAANKALATEITRRAEQLSAAPNGDIALGSDGAVRWLGAPVGRLVGTDDVLKPRILILADEQLTGVHRDKVQQRLDRWLGNQVATLLKPLVDLFADQTLAGIARGVAFRIVERLGSVERREIATDVQGLDQEMRAGLRRHGVRFGAYHIFIPALLKPGPAGLICLLWGVKNDRLNDAGLAEVPNMSAAGRTSFPANPEIGSDIYGLCGFRLLGSKAVRIDILERLADLIRPAVSWKSGDQETPPEGAIGDRTFYVSPAMLSLLGATHADMDLVLNGLGYRGETVSIAEFEKRKPVTQAEISLPAAPSIQADNAVQKEFAPEASVSLSQSDESDSPSAATSKTNTPAQSVNDESAAAASQTCAPLAAPPAEQSAGTPLHDSAAACDEIEQERLITIWHLPHRERPANRRNQRGRRGIGDNRSEAAGQNAGRRERIDGKISRGKRNANRQKKRDGVGDDRNKSAPVKSWQDRKPNRKQSRIDPDSPFAKLMALKKQLEKGDG